METQPPKRRILILGGGFAGNLRGQEARLEKRLGRAIPNSKSALVAKENFVLFTPMLHEVAGGDLEVTDIVQPLRKMLRHTRVGIADIEAIDLVKRQVRIRHKDVPRPVDLSYDHLVLAVGSVTNFFHTPGLEEHALTMKSLGDAILIRNRVIDALGLADNQLTEADQKKTLTVVVAGGGFAGIETAGAVNDLLRDAVKFYPGLKKNLLRVVVVHPGDVILPELSASLGRYAQRKLGKRGVEIRLKTKVASFDGHEVVLDDGSKIPTRLLIWTAGTTPPPLTSRSRLRTTQRGRSGDRPVHAGARLARRVGARRLCARSRSAQSGKILSADGATRHSPGAGAGR